MKIVLAYSGGLDTSVALHWLRERYGAEVIAFCADIGQLESLEDVGERAWATGASEVRVENLTDRYLWEFAMPAMRAHARYENKYLLAAPLSRPLIAQRMVEIANEVGADAIAHGATGKGNDQVRFYTSAIAQRTHLKVLAPVIDWDMHSRDDEIAYAKKHCIPLSPGGTSPYSIDTNVWGTSIECGVLDDLNEAPPADAWQSTTAPRDAPETPRAVTIRFDAGVPTALDGHELGLADLVSALNAIGNEHGVGRTDIVENRIVGFKTRGLYEAPAAHILMTAHSELQSVVLDRETSHFADGIAPRYAEMVYYGYWFSDLRRGFDAFVDSYQHQVTGEVRLVVHKGSCVAEGRHSPYARYRRDLASYAADDVFDHSSGAGFAYVWALPLA